jgi:hypothetical protein
MCLLSSPVLVLSVHGPISQLPRRGVWSASCADGKFSARWLGLAWLAQREGARCRLAPADSSQPIAAPWRRQPHHCWIEIGRLFHAPRPVRLRLGPVDPRCALLFGAWELGPARGDPPHLRWAEGAPLVATHFLPPGRAPSRGLRPTTVAAIYTCHCCLR